MRDFDIGFCAGMVVAFMLALLGLTTRSLALPWAVIWPWLGWGMTLLLQNAAFTWTSRSRNSDSLKEHATASFFSNGVYFLNLFIGVDKIKEAHGALQVLGTILFYTAFTMTGAVYSHHLLLKRKKKACSTR